MRIPYYLPLEFRTKEYGLHKVFICKKQYLVYYVSFKKSEFEIIC